MINQNKNLTRVISEDGSVVAMCVNSTAIVAKIEEYFKTSAVVSAALGRLATATCMMGYTLKNDEDTITVKINGDGPCGSLIAVSNSSGNVKAYVTNPIVELPLNDKGKLDVKNAVGTNGMLTVIKDIGLKDPYVGSVNIVSGEIAEDITSYFAISEQTPNVCALGVLVNPDLTIKAAGGYIITLLPFTPDENIKIIEENLKQMPSVSSLINDKLSPEEICNMLLKGLNPNILDEATVEYKCDCSKQRVIKALLAMGKEELKSLSLEENTSVTCHFCPKIYNFSGEEIEELIK